VVICLERNADLHMAQLMPLPLTVSWFSKIQIGFTFLVPAYPGSPGQRAVKRVCVFFLLVFYLFFSIIKLNICQLTCSSVQKMQSYPGNYTVSQKNKTPNSCPLLHQISTDFQNSFTIKLIGKFVPKTYINTAPHPKCVATLPCEIFVFKKSPFLRSKWSKLLCKT